MKCFVELSINISLHGTVKVKPQIQNTTKDIKKNQAVGNCFYIQYEDILECTVMHTHTPTFLSTHNLS